MGRHWYSGAAPGQGAVDRGDTVNVTESTLGLLAAVRGVFAPSRFAHAHSGTHSYVYVVTENDAITGNVQFPINDLNAAAGLTIPQDEPGARSAIAANIDVITKYASSHLTLSSGDLPWDLTFTGHRVLERKAGSYAILEYAVSGIAPVPRRFTVTYDGLMEVDHHHEAIVIVKTAAGIGKLRTEDEQRIPVTAGTTRHEVTIPEESVVNDVKGAAESVAATSKELLRRARKRLGR